jgi:hypothetical protein
MQIMIDQKQPKNVECYSYLSSLITTNDARCTRDSKSRLPLHKQHVTSRTISAPSTVLHFKQQTSAVLHLGQSLGEVLTLGQFGK